MMDFGGAAIAGLDLCEALPRLLRNLTGYYELCWEGPPGASSVEIRADRGCAGPMKLDSASTHAIH